MQDSLFYFFAQGGGSGLSGLADEALSNWIQPLYLVGVAVFVMIFLKDRAWMKLIGFIGIAAIVGLFVFMGDKLVGENGSFTRVGERGSNLINTVKVVADYDDVAPFVQLK